MRRQLVVTTAALLLSGACSLLLNRFPEIRTALWPWSSLVLATLHLTLANIYSKRESAADLVQALIAGFIARFLCGLVFLLVVFLATRTEFSAVAAHFLAHWLLFTALETVFFRENR